MPEEAQSMKRYPPSGISVLVVGGGIGGLTCAIEAYRKGHDVRLVERRLNFFDRGALIGLPAPAIRILKNWPGFLERLAVHAIKPRVRMMKHDFTHIGDFPLANAEHPSMPMSRPSLHKLLYSYVQELGIPVRLGGSVTEYFEDENQAGIVYSDGTRETADVVVAADGVGSKAWDLVLGEKQDVISSGFACHLVTFPAGPALENPVIREGFGDLDSGVMFNLGPNAHFVIGKTPEKITWCLIHRDHAGANEDWGQTSSAESALQYIPTWAPFYKEVIKAAPDDDVLVWRLMWRDPQPKYVSPQGHVVQIGDAAHPFLPTSAAGAGMAIEDGATLASCLQLSGRSNVPLAARVYNLFRYERVCCAQKVGFRNRETFHRTNWDGVEKDPSSVSTFNGTWIAAHEVEKYVLDNYGNAANHILTGAPFRNTNAVPGYKFKPWTVCELLEASDKGQPIIDEGEWYT